MYALIVDEIEAPRRIARQRLDEILNAPLQDTTAEPDPEAPWEAFGYTAEQAAQMEAALGQGA